MATQIIGIQIEVTGQEQNSGKIAGFVETVKELAGVYFNTNGGSQMMDPAYRANLTVEQKSEIDADLNSAGPA
ncbi:MAG: hypothetical protein FI707_11645 [SAR202 cluster bacterium]|jgi:hypothetical protein|nr:hypothetical protein [Chloroflexota bacterium]MDP6421567.1 hypothetical protein [SAR202 cluster bacterium]HAL48174.1 hypothetical protein [Dehalococcoidia bacterium]MDP6664656.1 hypothetical protein [SAR202 cluster bacterium]MDP6798483.1 hypothetical protein [SAR202 cluster bacterium]|tara:strand:- start:6076 stop:6294 length:219 start_codon:yes stop_codon:yes gene_type:complete